MKTYTDLGAAQANAEHQAYDLLAIALQSSIFYVAADTCADYNGGSWAFAANDEGTLGFWYPLDQEFYAVNCENYYANPAMPATAFGAACTLLALNHLVWQFHSQGANPQTVRQLSDQFHALRNWVFDLSEANQLDGAAVAGFID